METTNGLVLGAPVGGAPSFLPLSCFADESGPMDFRDAPVRGWVVSWCADGWVVSRHADEGEPSLSRGGGPSVWGAKF
jgi:hypothetical protein